jgi:hypothetical protein
MRFEFTYTLDDLNEALLSAANAQRTEIKRYRVRASRVLALPFFIVLAVGLWFAIHFSMARGQSANIDENLPDDVVVELITSTIPALVVAGMVAMMYVVSWRKARWKRPRANDGERRRSLGPQVLGYVLLTIVTFAVILPLNPWATCIWYPTRGELALLRVGPWLMNLAAIFIWSALHRHWQPREQWFNNPGFRRPKVLELDDQGFRLSDSINRYDFKWDAFIRAAETTGLLVLVAEDKKQWMIPKRAFTDEGEIDRARALIQKKITDSQFLVQPGGFAVLPKPVVPVSEGVQFQSKKCEDSRSTDLKD